jgi:hypothetical protein
MPTSGPGTHNACIDTVISYQFRITSVIEGFSFLIFDERKVLENGITYLVIEGFSLLIWSLKVLENSVASI